MTSRAEPQSEPQPANDDTPCFASDATPPAVEKRPTARRFHTATLTDDYAWLAAENWREVLSDPQALPPDIAALIAAENAYCEATLAPLKPLRATLVREMRARIKEDDADPPWPDGPFAYYERYREGGEHPLYCRRPRAGGAEEVLLDGDALAEPHEFFDIGEAIHARDHAQFAWSADDKGSEFYSIRSRAIADGVDRDDVTTHTDGTIVWSADSRSFYYVRVDENHRTAQVFRHEVGADPASDALVIEEKDPAWFVALRESRCGRFAIVSIHGHDASECWLVDLTDKDAKPLLVEPRAPKLRYDVEPRGDEIYIHTNDAGAEDFAIRVAPLADPRRANWRDVVAHQQGRMIVISTVFAGRLVWIERERSLPRLVIHDFETGERHAIAFDEEAYSLRLETGYEFDTTALRFVYSSMTTPDEIYDYDMRTRERVLIKRREIPSGHDPKHYVTQRIFAVSHDGESVPVTLLKRADLAPSARAPLLLYGYGAYGHALSASFNADALSLVDRGFVYAYAHIRGGTDKGWRWYEDGKLEKKQNSFEDFLACARRLIEEGYTSEGLIVAEGASAGGMLMGAVVNMAPHLFAGVIAGVPFVDVLNTILRADLPLTPPEWLEWGDPITDPQAFERIAAYSPYDNISAQDYPPILAVAGLTDPRVTYWEPLKWVTKLREKKTSSAPVVMHTLTGAGHAGAPGRFERLEDDALTMAFAIACVASRGAALQRSPGS